MDNTTQVSVAEALRQAHIALRKDLERLEEVLQSSRGTDASQMHASLERTRSHLAEHFRFEEENGYMDAVLHREPNRARAVENLRAEHRHLAQQLDGLIEQTRTEECREEMFRDRLRSWLAEIRGHEARENSLVQDVFNVDLSGQD